MKNIKTFEDIFGRFKVGDIVTCIRDGNFLYLKMNDTYIVTSSDFDLIEVSDYNGRSINSLNRTRFRLATPEEIDEFELKTSQNKFNL